MPIFVLGINVMWIPPSFPLQCVREEIGEIAHYFLECQMCAVNLQSATHPQILSILVLIFWCILSQHHGLNSGKPIAVLLAEPKVRKSAHCVKRICPLTLPQIVLNLTQGRENLEVGCHTCMWVFSAGACTGSGLFIHGFSLSTTHCYPSKQVTLHSRLL